MGLMELSDFRDELDAILGDRVDDNDRLDRWVNFGYLDLSGALDFDELNDLHDLNVQSGTADYDVPDSTRLIKAVVDNDEGEYLDYVDPTEYFRLDRSVSGDALRWTRFANKIRLHPTPSSNADFLVLRKIDPTLLDGDTDTTVIPATWDTAVHILSVYHGLLALDERETKVNSWLSRAITYIQTRATQEEMFAKESGLGLSFALPLEKRLSLLQQTGGS